MKSLSIRPIAAAPGRIDRRRRLALAGLGALTAAGLGALSVRVVSHDGSAAAPAGEAMVSHQLGWLKGVQFGGNLMALHQGYFAEEGLAVSFASGGPGTDYRTLVSSGQSLVSESNVPGMIDGYLQGQPVVAFAAVLQREPGCLISAAARPLASLHDMAGKTIGVPGSIRGQIVALLRRAGLDPEAVKLVPVGSDPSLLAAGQVDAYYSWATTAVPALRGAGFEPHVLPFADIGIQGYGQALITRRDTLEQHHGLLVRYTRALIRGWDWMVKNPEETARIMVAEYAPPGTRLEEQIAQARMMLPYITAGDAAERGMLWISPTVFEAGVALAREAGTLGAETEVDVSRLVDQSVIRAAHGSHPLRAAAG